MGWGENLSESLRQEVGFCISIASGRADSFFRRYPVQVICLQDCLVGPTGGRELILLLFIYGKNQQVRQDMVSIQESVSQELVSVA